MFEQGAYNWGTSMTHKSAVNLYLLLSDEKDWLVDNIKNEEQVKVN